MENTVIEPQVLKFVNLREQIKLAKSFFPHLMTKHGVACVRVKMEQRGYGVIPNAVLFKLDNGKPCLFLKDRNDNWDFENIVHLNGMENLFTDISPSPFEFQYCYVDGNRIITDVRKATLNEGSFLSLGNKVFEAISADFFNNYRYMTNIDDIKV